VVTALRVRTVDAFTDRPFTGNPAAVVILESWRNDSWLAALARELNLAETAYVVPEPSTGADYRLRWFTPAVEVDLCGHATLAAAHCLYADGISGPIRFQTRSGVLTVAKLAESSYALDFPALEPVQILTPEGLVEALGTEVQWAGRGGTNDVIAVVSDEAAVRGLEPDIRSLAAIDARGVIVTAAGDAGQEHDFVSRFFAPNVGVDEDPVTGSAHTVLAPYWSRRFGRTKLVGLQVSARSGLIGTEVVGDRVILSGSAVTMLDGALVVFD
jgi:PhzF family phenazine biosynthesis protein